MEPPRSRRFAAGGWIPTMLPLFLLLLGVRLLLFLQIPSDPLQDAPRSDAEIYHQWASQWAKGESYDEGSPFWRSPGYPAFLSVLYRIFGPEPRWAILVQQLLGILTLVLVAEITRRRWGPIAGWTAGILPILHGPSLFFETQLLPASLATALYTTGLLLLLLALGSFERSRGGPSLRELGLAGLLLGLATVVRPNLGLALPGAGAILFFTFRSERPSLGARLVPLLVFLSAGLVPLTGTTGWNLLRSGELVVTGANGGMNLYFSYHDDAGATFHVPESRWSDPLHQKEQALAVAARELGRNVTAPEASAHFADKAKTWIENHPLRTLELAFLKLRGFFTPHDLSILASPKVSSEELTLLRVLGLPFTLLAGLGLAGSLLGGRSTTRVVFLGTFAILLGAMLFFTYTRFRIVGVPILAFGASSGLGTFLQSRKTRISRRLLLGFAASLGLVFAVGLGSPSVRKESQKSTSVSWWALGNAWRQRWDGEKDDSSIDRAEFAYEESRRANPESPLADWALARLDQDCRRKPKEAREKLEDLVERHPNYVQGLLDLAVARRRGTGGPQDLPGALDLFERASRGDSGLPEPIYELEWHEALWKSGRPAEARVRLDRFEARGNPAEREAAQKIRKLRYGQ